MKKFLMSQFWTEPFNPVLPTVESDDLTYYEFVKKIFYHYHELVKTLESVFRGIDSRFEDNEKDLEFLRKKVEELNQKWLLHHDRILEQAMEYTDKRNVVLKNYIDHEVTELTNSLDSFFKTLSQRDTENFNALMRRIEENTAMLSIAVKQVDDKLGPLKSELQTYTNKAFHIANIKLHEHIKVADSQFAEMSGEILILESKMNALKLQIINMYDALDSKLTEQIAEALEELKNQVADINGNDILVTDPTTGKSNNLRNTLANVYSGLWWAKITAKDYDAMKLNASAYDSRKITAIDFDTHARFIFFDELYLKKWWEALKEYQAEYIRGMQELNEKLTMRNPITGRISDLKDVIYDILDKLHNEWNYTANEYDHLKSTAGRFDGSKITAFEYDFFAKKYLNNIPA